VASDAAEAARNDGVPHGHLKSSRGNSGSSGLVVTSTPIGFEAAGRVSRSRSRARQPRAGPSTPGICCG
jgi:hypothetical protein